MVAQRQALQAKAEDVRETVEQALSSREGSSREGRRPGERSRSIADLDAFRLGAEVLATLRSATPEQLPEVTRDRACEALESSLLALAEASVHFEQRAKREALDRCRSQLARTVGLLVLASSGETTADWIRRLEDGMVPAVAGFARWIAPSREPAMSWRDAPLYVEAHDLARGLLERVDGWPVEAPLRARLANLACDLVEAVSLALTFPQQRASWLRRADAAVVQIRVLRKTSPWPVLTFRARRG